MKRNEMQSRNRTRKVSAPVAHLQAVNDLRLRALRAKHGFLSLGTPAYIGFVETQAAREGKLLDKSDKAKIRQVINANLSMDDKPLVELLERALETQKAA